MEHQRDLRRRAPAQGINVSGDLDRPVPTGLGSEVKLRPLKFLRRDAGNGAVELLELAGYRRLYRAVIELQKTIGDCNRLHGHLGQGGATRAVGRGREGLAENVADFLV